MPFMERGMKLLREDGRLGFIIDRSSRPKNSPSVSYRSFGELDDAIAGKAEIDIRSKWGEIDDQVWSFDQPDLLDVHRESAKRHGTIGQRPDLQISVGLQTLYGKLINASPSK